MRKLSPYLSKSNRLNLARRIKRGRKYDRAIPGTMETWETRRKLKDYSYWTKVPIDQELKKLISKKGKIKFLDIGCGKGYALKDAKELFGNTIETHGLRLIGRGKMFVADEFAQRMVDKLHVGSIENYIFKEKFDFIFSFVGFGYISNATLGLEKVCNALSVGGKAIIHTPYVSINKTHIQKLKDQGFEINYKSRFGYPTIVTIVRTSKRKANLEVEVTKEAKKRINRKINHLWLQS